MEFAGVIVEKWVKVLTNADLDSDEMVCVFFVHCMPYVSKSMYIM